jgi:hypothetical protein
MFRKVKPKTSLAARNDDRRKGVKRVIGKSKQPPNRTGNAAPTG